MNRSWPSYADLVQDRDPGSPRREPPRQREPKAVEQGEIRDRRRGCRGGRKAYERAEQS